MASEKSPIGVIFDMDGVLVDSGDAHFESWRLVALELGKGEVTRGQFERLFGRRSTEIIAEWFNITNAGEAARIDQRKEEIYREILSGGVPVMPGARELVAALHGGGMRIGIGSSGPPENIALVVEAMGLRPMLSAIVTGMDVQRGKPDPQVFLLAADRMGTGPNRTVVVEDAPSGVEAAHRAGMRCIALTSSHPAEFLAKADHVTNSLSSINTNIVSTLVL